MAHWDDPGSRLASGSDLMGRHSPSGLLPQRRLLLLGCSQRKRRVRGSVPAMNLYDGPQFRSLRRLQIARSIPSDVVIRIVSAKYGLLKPQDLIQEYDRRLNPKRDGALVNKVRRRLQRLEVTSTLSSAFSTLGRDYLAVVPTSWSTGGRLSLRLATGPPGMRVRQMLDWLKRGS
jgi:hypothetical protein